VLNILRERMRALLLGNRVGVLSISGGDGTWAMPVQYRANDLEVDCLVPGWSDIAYHVERCPDVLLVVLPVFPSSPGEPLCWLQLAGRAREVADPMWAGLLPRGTSETLAAELYLVIRVTPRRMDLIDESRGWGARETLEMDDVLQ
jgi:hypothetical protein